ncbi:pilus assembly protein PilM [Candidatus Omnitrophota bacterium]
MNKFAISITNSFIRLSLADGREYELNISGLKEAEIPLRLKDFLAKQKINQDNSVLLISRSQVSVKYMNFPSVDKTEIRNMIEFELDNLFPYKPEELVFDQAIIETTQDGYSRVMLVAVQKELIQKEISLLRQAGLLPESVQISTVSLFNQFLKKKKVEANYLLVNLEDNFLDIIVVHKQGLSFNRGVSLAQAEAATQLIKELKETIDRQQAKGSGISRIILSGRGIDINGLAQSIQRELSIAVETDAVTCVTRGAAAFAAKQNCLKINLLPSEFKTQRDRLKRRRYLLYFVTLLLLNTSLIANIIFLNARHKQQYLTFLKSEIEKIESQASLLQKKLRRTQILQGYRNSGKLSVGLLAEVYRVAPEGMRLTNLEIRGQPPTGTLVLAGQAGDSQAVLNFASKLKDSYLINQAEVNYITKKKSGLEEVVDFEIRSAF